MKTTFLPILLLFSLSIQAQPSTQVFINLEPAKTIATYSLHFQQDSTNPSSIRKIDMLLFIGENISKFMSKSTYMNDTITRKFSSFEQEQAYYLNPQRPMPNFIYQIFKNYPQSKLTYTEYIPSNYFRFEEDLDLFHWQLTGDTATVCGYKSQKATCNFGGRSWVAWFAPELPYTDGPYKFNGLPGLIVKVGDTRNHYVFELLSIGKPANTIMIDIKDTEYMQTTKLAFFKAQDAFREDIVNRARQASPDNDSQQTLIKSFASRNNPIELLRK